MAWVYILSEKGCADNDYNRLYTTGFYDPAGKWHSDEDFTDKEAAAQRAAHLNGGTGILAPKLLDMLIRIHAAEFGYGAWPEEREITNIINEAGGTI